jgi:secreted trypsin-like serine protease
MYRSRNPPPTGICRGDSGGPQIQTVGGQPVLVGINSAGDPACQVSHISWTCTADTVVVIHFQALFQD